MEEFEEKWFYQMNWCKEHKVSSLNSYWWNKSKEAYKKYKNEKI